MKSHMQFARRLMTVMDTKFNVLGIRFGIDPILDFIPGFGSFFGAIISCYLFWIAYKLHVPRWVYFRMGWYILLDFVLGQIPFIGFIVDLFYRANVKNLAILERFIEPEVLEGVLVEE